MSSDRQPLVLVSNRGPVTYQEDGSLKRGTGGLVTALTGLAAAIAERPVEAERRLARAARELQEVVAKDGHTDKLWALEMAYDVCVYVISILILATERPARSSAG